MKETMSDVREVTTSTSIVNRTEKKAVYRLLIQSRVTARFAVIVRASYRHAFIVLKIEDEGKMMGWP